MTDGKQYTIGQYVRRFKKNFSTSVKAEKGNDIILPLHFLTKY